VLTLKEDGMYSDPKRKEHVSTCGQNAIAEESVRLKKKKK
jgi:hypothetical protein